MDQAPPTESSDSSFSMIAPSISSVHHLVLGLPRRQAPATFLPQLSEAVSCAEHGPLNVPSLPLNANLPTVPLAGGGLTGGWAHVASLGYAWLRPIG